MPNVSICCIVWKFSLQCFDTVGWVTVRHPALKKLDAGLLMVTVWLELCTSSSSSCHHHLHHLASIKSRTETFWYWLTQVHLENGC